MIKAKRKWYTAFTILYYTGAYRHLLETGAKGCAVWRAGYAGGEKPFGVCQTDSCWNG